MKGGRGSSWCQAHTLYSACFHCRQSASVEFESCSGGHHAWYSTRLCWTGLFVSIQDSAQMRLSKNGMGNSRNVKAVFVSASPAPPPLPLPFLLPVEHLGTPLLPSLLLLFTIPLDTYFFCMSEFITLLLNEYPRLAFSVAGLKLQHRPWLI